MLVIVPQVPVPTGQCSESKILPAYAMGMHYRKRPLVLRSPNHIFPKGYWWTPWEKEIIFMTWNTSKSTSGEEREGVSTFIALGCLQVDISIFTVVEFNLVYSRGDNCLYLSKVICLYNHFWKDTLKQTGC